MLKKNKITQSIASKSSWKLLYEKQYIQISNRINEIKKILYKWNEEANSNQDIPSNQYQTILQIFRNLAKYSSNTRYQTFIEKKIIHDQMIKRIENSEEVFLHYKIFGQQTWNLVISEQIAEQIINQVQQVDKLKQILTRISLYLNGYISLNDSFQTKQNKLTQIGQFQSGQARYYKQEIHYNILYISIGVQKLPKLEYNNKKVIQMTLCPYLQILKMFVEEPQRKQIQELLYKTQKFYQMNPSKNLSEEKIELDKELMAKLGKKVQYFKFLKENPENQEKIIKFTPQVYKSIKCQNQQDYEEYLHALKTYEDNKINLQKKIENKKNQSEQKKLLKFHEHQRLKKQFSFTSSNDLVKVYDKIPNKKYQLTPDEKNIVSFDSNLIVIGRSGTGKTLCALLRVFIIELFYKQRQFKRLNIQKRSFQASDIDKILGLKNIFLTASLYLIKQIKKQYDQMKDHMKALLLQHKAKKQQKSQKTQKQDLNIDFNPELITDHDQDIDLDKLIDQFQQKIQRMKSLNQLNQKDYPGFFSIKNFIKMLDGTLHNPMFYKPIDQILQEKPQQNIKKSNQKNNKQINQITQGQILQEQKNQFQDQQNIGWIEKQNNLQEIQKQNQKQQKKEVDYDIFTNQFWPDVPKQYFKSQKQLQPANVWAQIYSVIKGSYESHKSHTKSLSKIQYLKTSRKQHVSQIQYKRIVYTIFQYYENWKQKTNHYDFMDLVNHILSDIQIYGYQGPMLNYLFIDEVQDLPPATLYLVSKIVSNGVFYCGDSAQTIAKGVNFKFRDILKIFSPKFKLEPITLPAPQKIQLTINFRSHNQILQLGHSVITIIEKLFPGSIDSLSKQVSSYRGPVPIIMECKQVKLLQILSEQIKDYKNIDPQKLSQYFQNSPDSKYYRLGPQQIVLVRNIGEKQKLPYRLNQGVVLTFQDVKGLQYDDVVLVNFFSSSRCKDKWKLLKYLDVKFEQIQESVYLQSLKNRVKLKGHHLDGDSNIETHFDWNTFPDHSHYNNKKYFKVPYLDYCKDINQENVNAFYQLLMQLKVLYTAITRARKTFIIYDNNIPKQLQHLWTKMKAIQHLNQKNFDVIKKQIHQFRKIHKNKNSPLQQKAWAKQGYKWYIRKNYEQAIRCFINGKDIKTARRIQGQMKADQAGFQLRRIRYQMKNPDNLSKQQFKIFKNFLQTKQKSLSEKFNEAGRIFEQIQLYKKAGSCYFEAQSYQKALKCFQKIRFIRGIAQCHYLLQNYNRAAQNYQKLKNYQKMLQCLQKANNLNILYQKLFQYLQCFSQSQAICKKYGLLLFRQLINNQIKQNSQYQILFQQNLKLIYRSPQYSNQQKDIKRYILIYCINNAKKLLNIKVNIQELQKKQQVIIQQKKKLINQKKLMQNNFQKQYPFKQLSLAIKFYKLKKEQIQYNRPKPFAQACYQHKIQYQNAEKLVQRVQPLVQLYQSFNSQIQNANQRIIEINQKNSLELGNFKDLKDIQRTLNLLGKIYDKNIFQGYDEQKQRNLIKLKHKKIKLDQTQEQDIQDLYNLETSSFLDQSFDQQYSLSNFEDSQFQEQNKSDNFQNIIFNFTIAKHKIDDLIKKSKNILMVKMKNYVQNPLKGPFGDQHHLQIQGKIQDFYLKQQKKKQQIIHFLRKIQYVGQDYLALLVCEYYKLYDLSKKFIISKILRLNKTFSTKKIVTKVPYSVKKYQMNYQIQGFINKFKNSFLQNQCYRTLLNKQRIIDSIVQSLLIQGLYRNVIPYINQKTKIMYQLGYIFMDYQLLTEYFKKTNNIKKINYQYFIIKQKRDNQQFIKKLNAASIQQIFYLSDQIQQKPFFTDINWKQGVIFKQQDINEITQKISNQISKAQYSKRIIQQQIKEYKRYLNQILVQKHDQQISNRNKNLEQLRKIRTDKQKQKNQLNSQIVKNNRNNIPLLQQQSDDLISLIKTYKKQIDQVGQIKTNFRRLNNLLKVQQKQIILTFQSQFYQFNQFNLFYIEFIQKQIIQTCNTSNSSNLFMKPKFKIDYTMNKQIKIIQQKIQRYKNSIENNQKLIQQNSLKIRRIKQINNDMLNKIGNLSFQNQQIQKKLHYYENIIDSQKKQRQKFQLNIKKIQENLKQINQQINQIQKNSRKKLYQQRQKQIIWKNKNKHTKKIKQKIRSTNQLPIQYDNCYFKVFIQMRNSNLLGRNVTFTQFKKPINKLLQNFEKLDKLDTFQKCQIILFYLSIVVYQQKNIFEFLKYQIDTQIQNQLDNIRQQIKYKKNQLNVIYQKIQKQGGYKMPHHQRELYKINNQISKLQSQFKNIRSKPLKNMNTTYHKVQNLIFKVFQKYQNINSQSGLQFIELILGFFQCRIPKNCQSLWFLDQNYVICKSSSVLVKQILKKKSLQKNKKYQQKVYCYYFDQNKEFVIMKLLNTYTIMRKLLNQKHFEFMKNMKFWQQRNNNQINNVNFLYFLNRRKQDKQNLFLHQICEFDNKSKLKENYYKFENRQIQFKLAKHKQDLFIYYYSNGIKTPQGFHFIHYQLKVIHQMTRLLNNCKVFSNLMINDFETKFNNLVTQFTRFKFYLQKHKQLSNQSCQNQIQVQQKYKKINEIQVENF